MKKVLLEILEINLKTRKPNLEKVIVKL